MTASNYKSNFYQPSRQTKKKKTQQLYKENGVAKSKEEISIILLYHSRVGKNIVLHYTIQKNKKWFRSKWKWLKKRKEKEEEEDRDNGMWLTFSRFAFDKFSKVCTPISPCSYSQRGMCVMNVGGMSLIHTPLLKKSLCRFVGTSYYFHYFKDAQNISPNIPCNKRETWETMKEMSQTTSVSHRHFPWKYFPFFFIFRCLQQTVMSSTTTTTNAHWKVLKWSAVYPTSAFLYYSIRKKGLPDDLPRIWIHDMRVHRPFPFTSCCILFWKKRTNDEVIPSPYSNENVEDYFLPTKRKIPYVAHSIAEVLRVFFKMTFARIRF